MKRTGLILSTVLLLILSLYLAYEQGYLSSGTSLGTDLLLSSTPERPLILASGIVAIVGSLFLSVFDFFTHLLNGSMVAAIMVMALIVELITLYPAVSIQLKQKKIHLFHKKLVDRFKTGELALSKSKQELNVLYAVNEKLHVKGAWLVFFQALAFVIVLTGLYLVTLANNINLLAVGSLNVSLLVKPVTFYLPLVAALAYLLHALIKIHIKQTQDYLSSTQLYIALTFSIIFAVVIFFFSGYFATLLTVYFMTQLTFATMRYLIVEEKSKSWSKLAQKELLQMLQTAKIHQNKLQHASQKFNHLAPVRHLNFHLLEEGISMSLAFVLAITYSGII